MALKTGSNKRLSNEEAVDLSSLANLMKLVNSTRKEADSLELQKHKQDRINEQ